MSNLALLVKSASPPRDVHPAFGGRTGLTFTSLTRDAPESVHWHRVEARMAKDTNAWDLCHALMSDGMGIAGMAAPDFAEPDLEQQWLTDSDVTAATRFAAARPSADGPNPQLPFDPKNLYWFRDGRHAQLDAARGRVGISQADQCVRIAHLDTGYDPEHITLPRNLRTDLARNFVDGDNRTDAIDHSDGFFSQLGHGTGTLGILAGNKVDGDFLGGAPHAEIVPIRVASSVVLFKNSAIVRALNYVHELAASGHSSVHVLTMSMGGLASRAWAEAVNRLYEAGVFCVAAAGNNFGNLPTHHVVYPARFRRVVAACGVMADGNPWADLSLRLMSGNYGPKRTMRTALAAYTPNVPWARFGCPRIVDADGGGTSSATPQIAAAAALWIQAHRTEWERYSEGWMKVEAVRKALFESAEPVTEDKARRLGRGSLRAEKALDIAPAAENALKAEKRDRVSFPLLRVLTGLGLAARPDRRQEMLELEALQLSQKSAEIAALLPDPEDPPADLPAADRQAILSAMIDEPEISQVLRDHLRAHLGRKVHALQAPLAAALPVGEGEARADVVRALDGEIPEPAARRLRVFAFDPSMGAELVTLSLNRAVLETPWEKLEPGPVGDYLEVVDVDPASNCCYVPVNLDNLHLAASEGLAPSEGNPGFHQQMVYAVAMKTIRHFEHALGRVALWAPRWNPPNHPWADNSGREEEPWEAADAEDQSPRKRDLEEYVRRLRIYPHALREANAFYSPQRKALLFGYFSSSRTNPGRNLPGGVVFTCLSHDIIAHETTHALLDGLHRRYREATNPDVPAFHEAFADLVALFQHFTLPEALRHQIARTRGDLGRQNLLVELALQFGEAIGHYGALRNAIGGYKDGKWQPYEPSTEDYERTEEPHARGAVLVAAVFDAYLQIYKARTADLLRLATGGSGILPEGAITQELVNRLADAASKTAKHFLNICIRALDYCPPVDITFGEYLRAMITADRDLVPDDVDDMRVALISAFRARGIYPGDVNSLSVDSLVWQPPRRQLRRLNEIIGELDLSWNLETDRHTAYRMSRMNAAQLHKHLMDTEKMSDDEIAALGLDRRNIGRVRPVAGRRLRLSPIEVHSVRPARRIGPRGRALSDLVAVITQTLRSVNDPGQFYRGGCTALVDGVSGNIRYIIYKRVDHERRMHDQDAFGARRCSTGLRGTYFGDEEARREPFCMVHRGPKEIRHGAIRNTIRIRNRTAKRL